MFMLDDIGCKDLYPVHFLPYHGGYTPPINLSLEVWTVNDVVGMILCRDVMGGAPY